MVKFLLREKTQPATARSTYIKGWRAKGHWSWGMNGTLNLIPYHTFIALCPFTLRVIFDTFRVEGYERIPGGEAIKIVIINFWFNLYDTASTIYVIILNIFLQIPSTVLPKFLTLPSPLFYFGMIRVKGILFSPVENTLRSFEEEKKIISNANSLSHHCNMKILSRTINYVNGKGGRRKSLKDDLEGFHANYPLNGKIILGQRKNMERNSGENFLL